MSQKFIRNLSHRDLRGGRWGFEGPVGVTLDTDGGTNCHDVVYPPQASQDSLCGTLPPPTSWPVNRFPAAMIILLAIHLFFWPSFQTKEVAASAQPWRRPPGTAHIERASRRWRALLRSAGHGSRTAAHVCCAGGGA